MATMIRPKDSKALKIAYKIMGKPNNLIDQDTTKQKELKWRMLNKSSIVMR